MKINTTSKINKSAVILWVSAVFAGFFIFSLSSQTGEETAGLSERIAEFIAKLLYSEPDAVQFDNVHYFLRQTMRIILFAGFGFLTAEASYVTFTRFKIFNLYIFISILCSALAFFDEWRKQFISGRHFQLEEAFLNIISIFIGALIAVFILKLFRTIYKKSKKININI